jgi:hypothetical protein
MLVRVGTVVTVAKLAEKTYGAGGGGRGRGGETRALTGPCPCERRM